MEFLGASFKSHSSLDKSKCLLKKFLLCYQETLKRWGKHFSWLVIVLSRITSQFLRFNKNIKINGKHIFFEELSKINSILKIKDEFWLLELMKSQWMHAICDAFDTSWKKSVKKGNTNLITLSMYEYHLLKEKSNMFL